MTKADEESNIIFSIREVELIKTLLRNHLVEYDMDEEYKPMAALAERLGVRWT